MTYKKIITILLFILTTMLYYSCGKEMTSVENRLCLLSEATDLVSMAQQYARKPKEMGGGGGSLNGWKIPQNLRETDCGRYQLDESMIGWGNLAIYCYGNVKGYDGVNVVKVSVHFTRSQMKDEEIN